ncbi:hypothetical protein QZH41_001737 [Actinostola sp. cb2023]|nr:hypothetical protein QZH41_001737 [Actinostola sp. cb2023]
MNAWTIDEDEIMVSFDVISLFTSIPVNLALSITKERLDQDITLATRTNLSIKNIMRLMECVLNHCYFLHEGYHYQQIFGCPMGSPVSAFLANLVMEKIEELAIYTAMNPPKWWYRYVDDSHCCLKKNNIKTFHQHLNSINKHIQFTIQEETESGLSFLDTTTSRSNEGHITVNIYRKPTHTDRYLDFNSHHPTAHKLSVVNTLLQRANNIPSTEEGKKNELSYVKSVLTANNYPPKIIQNCERNIKSKKEQTSSSSAMTNDVEEQKRSIVVLPYVKGVSEKISRVLKQHNLDVAYRPMTKLCNLFPRPKDRKDASSETDIVYKIKCSECDFVYYGQTGRSMKTRTSEHRGAIAHNHPNSKIAQHSNETGHSFDFKNITIVDREKNYHQRLFLEAWFTGQDANAGNDCIQISEVYKTIMGLRNKRAQGHQARAANVKYFKDRNVSD